MYCLYLTSKGNIFTHTVVWY